MRRRLNLWHVLAALALACVAGAGWAATLSGSAMVRERIALPPGAVFEATLEDVSRADAPAVVLGRARLDPAGQSPFHFTLEYDAAALEAGHRYGVRATIRHEGRLLFVTDRGYPVLQGDSEAPLRMILRKVGGTSAAAATLQNTYWRLTQLGETPVLAAERQREAHLVLHEDTTRVAGSGGCNRLMGGYQLKGDALTFGRLASTMMACVDGMAQEQRFVAALNEVVRWRIDGQQLSLFDATGKLVARFEAVALR